MPAVRLEAADDGCHHFSAEPLAAIGGIDADPVDVATFGEAIDVAYRGGGDRLVAVYGTDFLVSPTWTTDELAQILGRGDYL